MAESVIREEEESGAKSPINKDPLIISHALEYITYLEHAARYAVLTGSRLIILYTQGWQLNFIRIVLYFANNYTAWQRSKAHKRKRKIKLKKSEQDVFSSRQV